MNARRADLSQRSHTSPLKRSVASGVGAGFVWSLVGEPFEQEKLSTANVNGRMAKMRKREAIKRSGVIARLALKGPILSRFGDSFNAIADGLSITP